MIRYVQGNLLKSTAEALVNPVNCVGTMGKGLAAKFKIAYPGYFDDYRIACEDGLLWPGKCYIYSDSKPQIISLPTKKDWRDPSKLEWIDQGLADLRAWILASGLKSVAVPALGCGWGGLLWADVQPLIEKYLHDLECEVEVYPPLRLAVPA